MMKHYGSDVEQTMNDDSSHFEYDEKKKLIVYFDLGKKYWSSLLLI